MEIMHEDQVEREESRKVKAFLEQNIYYLPANYMHLVLTINFEWINMTHKLCHCESGLTYKTCCRSKDKARAEEYISTYNSNKSHNTEPLNTNLPQWYRAKIITKKGVWSHEQSKKSKCHCGSSKKYTFCCKIMDNLRTKAYIRDIVKIMMGPKEHVIVNKTEIGGMFTLPAPIQILKPSFKPKPSLPLQNLISHEPTLSNSEICRTLKEMGFSAEQIVSALCAHKRNAPLSIEEMITNITNQTKEIRIENEIQPLRADEEYKETDRSVKLREEFICPITQEIMMDPVVIADGRSYERSAIEHWFKHNATSPITNIILKSKQIFPNIQLKNVIRSFTLH